MQNNNNEKILIFVLEMAVFLITILFSILSWSVCKSLLSELVGCGLRVGSPVQSRLSS